MVRFVLCTLLLSLLGACASTREYEPPVEFNQSALRARAETVADDEFRISATVASPEESHALFGVDLSEKNIQAVWIKVENHSDRSVFFLPTGLDPEYFAPHEVAFGFRDGFSRDSAEELAFHMGRMNFFDPILPGTAVSGFVYANREVGTKVVTVDLMSRGWAKSFTLFTAIPSGDTNDYDAVDRLNAMFQREATTDWTDLDDEAELRIALEELPCCSRDAEGGETEPLNVAVIGSVLDTVPAFLRRNFRTNLTAAPRFLFGRSQDIAASKQSGWVAAQPNTVRLWLTTLRFRGKPVWIGQVSTPLGGRFGDGDDSSGGVTIDADVDASRIDLIQDMVYSQYLARLGFVKGVGRVPESDPRSLFGGGSYHTDGLRAVFLFQPGNVSLAEIGFFPWERLLDHLQATGGQ